MCATCRNVRAWFVFGWIARYIAYIISGPSHRTCLFSDTLWFCFCCPFMCSFVHSEDVNHVWQWSLLYESLRTPWLAMFSCLMVLSLRNGYRRANGIESLFNEIWFAQSLRWDQQTLDILKVWLSNHFRVPFSWTTNHVFSQTMNWRFTNYTPKEVNEYTSVSCSSLV
jgi:hypothetical protein